MIQEHFEISNIIFDLGGVILDIDIKSVYSKSIQIGIETEYKGFGQFQDNKIFKDYEIGALSTDKFRNEIKKIAKPDFKIDNFDSIWNSIILEYPKENILILENLKTKYRTFLMSNTNELHYNYYTEILQKEFGYKNLDQLFEKAYYSHTSKMRKPEMRFFELILKQNNLDPKKTLFVDDFIENIEAANSLGIKTLHLKDGNTLANYFK